ncbi:MAG TPA: ribulose-phosphate 3-epimerase [Verrucomicrobiae bacterium]|nr:ribulose-phosphate 3-epimerase [Verrucomicrobiae bacterium]
MTEIIPAILTNDVSDFRHKYSELFGLSHYFTKLHIDFIDGDFLPGKTFEIKEMVGFKSPLTMIAHLMVNNPKDYFEDAKKAGFKYVTFHFEAFEHLEDVDVTIKAARDLDLNVGLAINPETKLYEAGKFLSKVDMVQLMSVHPGSQGRPFEISTFDKIKELRKLIPSVIICIDGGIKVELVRGCVLAGANWLVAGSAIWQTDNQKMAIQALQAESEIQK